MTSLAHHIDKHRRIVTIAWFIVLVAAIAGSKSIENFMTFILEKLYEIFIQHAAGKA